MDNPITRHRTREGRLEDKLLKQLASNEKMAELGRLSAGVIHEINTPLSVIAAASQMILQEKDLPESVSEMVERINLEVQRLSQLTRGILSFSREDDSVMGDTDVNLVLRDVRTFLKYETQKRSINVREDLQPQLPGIEANTNLLKQIFLNLIVNALQAMDVGGSLFLETAESHEGEVRVRIRDNGEGIPEEKLDTIFDPFFTTKEPGVGTGLGLFVTRNNLERIGGRIEVESKVGEGTCFTLYFKPYGQ